MKGASARRGDEMTIAEVVKYLQAYLDQSLPDRSEADHQGQGATVVSCMDGRLNRFLRPFRFVIRTAGAVAPAQPPSRGAGSGEQVSSL